MLQLWQAIHKHWSSPRNTAEADVEWNDDLVGFLNAVPRADILKAVHCIVQEYNQRTGHAVLAIDLHLAILASLEENQVFSQKNLDTGLALHSGIVILHWGIHRSWEMQAASRGDMYWESNFSHLVRPPCFAGRETISVVSTYSDFFFSAIPPLRRQPPDTRA